MRNTAPFIVLITLCLVPLGRLNASPRDAVCGGIWLTEMEMRSEIEASAGDSIRLDTDRSQLKEQLSEPVSKVADLKLRNYLQNFLSDVAEKKKVIRSHLILEDEQDIRRFLGLSLEQSKKLGIAFGSPTLTFLRGHAWLYGITLYGTYALVSHYDELKDAGFNVKTLLLVNLIAPKVLWNLPRIIRMLKYSGVLKNLEHHYVKALAASSESPQVLTFDTAITQKFDRAGKPLPLTEKTFHYAALDSETPPAFVDTYQWTYWLLKKMKIVPEREFNRSARVDLVFFSENGRRKLAVLMQRRE